MILKTRLNNDLDSMLAGALIEQVRWHGAEFKSDIFSEHPGLRTIRNSKTAKSQYSEYFDNYFQQNSTLINDAKYRLDIELKSVGQELIELCEKLVPSTEWSCPEVEVAVSTLPGALLYDVVPPRVVLHFKLNEFSPKLLHELAHIRLMIFLTQARIISESDEPDLRRQIVELLTDELLKRSPEPIAQRARVRYKFFHNYSHEVESKWEAWGDFRSRARNIAGLLKNSYE